MAKRISVPFATVADLEARWRALTPSEVPIASKRLMDASTKILAEYPEANRVVDDHDLMIRKNTLEMIVCDMVKRAMTPPPEIGGVPMDEIQAGAGPFSFRGRPLNPMGDLYLTKAERRTLAPQQVAMVPMGSRCDDEQEEDEYLPPDEGSDPS